MERLARSIHVASASDQYAEQLAEHKNQRERIEEKRRQINLLYDRLDPNTQTRYSKSHEDLERRSSELTERMIEKTLRSEYLLRLWREYDAKLDHLHQQLVEIQNELPSPQRLLYFEQVQTVSALCKVEDSSCRFPDGLSRAFV